jgi:RNA polymerase sigma factor (sigma-70 family)
MVKMANRAGLKAGKGKAPTLADRCAGRADKKRLFAKSDHAAAKSVNPMDHMGLVKAMANRLAAARGEAHLGDEWIGLCWEWLELCCRKFDPNNGANFSTYYVRACWRNATKYRDSGGTRNRTHVYINKNGMRTTGYHRETLASIHREDGSTLPLISREANPAREAMERDDLKDLRDKLRQYINEMMEPRDCEMLLARAGGRTLQDVGKDYGMTRERVRQLCNRVGYFDKPELVAELDHMPC